MCASRAPRRRPRRHTWARASPGPRGRRRRRAGPGRARVRGALGCAVGYGIEPAADPDAEHRSVRAAGRGATSRHATDHRGATAVRRRSVARSGHGLATAGPGRRPHPVRRRSPGHAPRLERVGVDRRLRRGAHARARPPARAGVEREAVHRDGRARRARARRPVHDRAAPHAGGRPRRRRRRRSHAHRRRPALARGAGRPGAGERCHRGARGAARRRVAPRRSAASTGLAGLADPDPRRTAQRVHGRRQPVAARPGVRGRPCARQRRCAARRAVGARHHDRRTDRLRPRQRGHRRRARSSRRRSSSSSARCCGSATTRSPTSC